MQWEAHRQPVVIDHRIAGGQGVGVGGLPAGGLQEVRHYSEPDRARPDDGNREVVLHLFSSILSINASMGNI